MLYFLLSLIHTNFGKLSLSEIIILKSPPGHELSVLLLLFFPDKTVLNIASEISSLLTV